MNKKLFFILSCMVLMCSAAIWYPVKPKTVWSNELQDKKGIQLYGIVAKDANHFYTLHNFSSKPGGYGKMLLSGLTSSFTFGLLTVNINPFSYASLMGNREKLVLKKFSYNLAEKDSKVLDLKVGKKKRLLEKLQYYGGDLRLITSFTNKKDKKSYLFIETIDLNTLESKKDIQKISEVSYEKKGKNKIDGSTYMFVMSRDSTKMLIFSNLPNRRKDNERFACTVLNEKLQVLWQNEIEIPYPDKQFVIQDFNVSNQGDVYVLGKLYADGNREVVRGKLNAKHQVLGFKNNGKRKTIYDINMDNKFITDIQITVNNDNNLICAGFYSKGDNTSRRKDKIQLSYTVDGIYNMVIDGKTKKVITNNTEDFDDDFYLQNLSNKRAKKTKKRMDKGKDVDVMDFDIDDLIVRDDGGVVMIGEQYRHYVETVTTTSSNGAQSTRTINHYIYNEIIVVNINPEGEIDWYRRIPKFQHTTEDGGYFSSYGKMVQNDRIHFFYNDHTENISLKDRKGRPVNWTKRPKKTAVMLTTVTKDGNMNRMPIANAKDLGIMMRPYSCGQLDGKNFLLYGEKGSKKYKLALVSPE